MDEAASHGDTVCAVENKGHDATDVSPTSCQDITFSEDGRDNPDEDTLSAERIAVRDESSEDDCTEIEDNRSTGEEEQAESRTIGKRRRRKQMNAEMQKRSIESLQAQLQKFKPATFKVPMIDKAARPLQRPASPTPAPPPKKRRLTSTAPTPSIPAPTSRPKPRGKTKPLKWSDDKLTHLPQHIHDLMDNLNSLGAPFELTLADAVRSSHGMLSQQGGDAAELLRLEREWKAANREHLRRMAAYLQRNGVVPIGSVHVPQGS